jgi:predicted unusual protein kinase regulating ubiquinone biosynthesis (AarF/ABC1/UbiB family)
MAGISFLMFSEDVNETDTEPLQNLVDFIKGYAPAYGMMHNDLHLGNIVYMTDT